MIREWYSRISRRTPRVCGMAALPLVLFGAGCSAKVESTEIQMKTLADMRREDMAKEYAEHLGLANWLSAYQGLSTESLRKRISYTDFTEAHLAIWRELGSLLVFTVRNDPKSPKELSALQENLPKDIPPESMRTWVCITYRTTLDPKDPKNRCYNLWLLFVDEKGQDKVAYFEYKPCP